MAKRTEQADREARPRRKVAFGAVLAALGLLLVLGVNTFAHACVHADGSLAPCYPAQSLISVMGVAVAILGVLRIFTKKAPGKVRAVLSGLAALCGLLAALLPGTALFPLCSMATMQCNTLMKPYALVLGLAIVVVAGLNAIWSLIRSGSKKASGAAAASKPAKLVKSAKPAKERRPLFGKAAAAEQEAEPVDYDAIDAALDEAMGIAADAPATGAAPAVDALAAGAAPATSPSPEPLTPEPEA